MKRTVVQTLMVLGLAGCATAALQDTRATEAMLTAAGFEMKTAETPEQVAHMQRMTPGKLVRRDRNGAPSYAYADPTGCRCLYIGGESQYQEYRKLARQRTAAAEEALVEHESSYPAFWTLWPLP